MLIRSVLFNFQGAFLNSVFLISQTTLLLYHIFSSLSRGFSKVFFEVFLIFFRSDVISEVSLAWFRKLFYYITSFRVCQEVFQTFLKFFLDFRSLCDVFKPFSRQLLYYTLFVRKSQPLFQEYSKKFCTISFPSFTQNIRFRIHKITKDPPRQVFSMIMHSPGVQI